MTREGFAVLAVATLGMVGLYAIAGPTVRAHFGGWLVRACLAAVALFVVGMALLGLPGAIVLEAIYGPHPNMPPDSAWPLAILITQAGAVMVAPASLVLRLAMPAATGWRHAGATALLTIAATVVFTLYIVGKYASSGGL